MLPYSFHTSSFVYTPFSKTGKENDDWAWNKFEYFQLETDTEVTQVFFETWFAIIKIPFFPSFIVHCVIVMT